MAASSTLRSNNSSSSSGSEADSVIVVGSPSSPPAGAPLRFQSPLARRLAADECRLDAAEEALICFIDPANPANPHGGSDDGRRGSEESVDDYLEAMEDMSPSELSPTMPPCEGCAKASAKCRRHSGLGRVSHLFLPQLRAREDRCSFCAEVKGFMATTGTSIDDLRAALGDHIKWQRTPIRKSHRLAQQDRRRYLYEAWKWSVKERLQAQAEGRSVTRRHLTVVYNPVSGSGRAKKIVDGLVAPMLRVAGLDTTVIPTQHRGHAIELMLALDPSATNGVLIAGGDGLVHEIITGLMRRPDAADVAAHLGIGITPAGSANAMAHELDRYQSRSDTGLIGNAVLRAIRDEGRFVDVIEHRFPGDKGEEARDPLYALSVFGWGLAGTIAKAADKLRWIPGQKRFRYDFAGLVSFIKDWPIQCFADLEYRNEDGTWTRHDHVQFTNLTASNLPMLGADHPISARVRPDDGQFILTWLDGMATRRQVTSMGMAMKHGKYLADHKASNSVLTTEFRLFPKPGSTTSFLVDGDPVDPRPVHVRNLQRRLRIFSQPTVRSSGPL